MSLAFGWLKRLAVEPPVRLFVRRVLELARPSADTRALWDISERPQYLLGLWYAARRAARDGEREISVIEFGVAGGNGLLVLEREGAAVERELGVAIKVIGFDNGAQGLPEFIGDHRDHPDKWRAGDFPMDEARLRSRLSARTSLVIGDVRTTVPAFGRAGQFPPIGFIAFDLDLYSSTVHALSILDGSERRMLTHVPLYFDDVDHSISHRFAGALLAIDEFNQTSSHVKIDRWRGIQTGRPFPEAPYLQKMYMAHDLDAISRGCLDREPLQRALQP